MKTICVLLATTVLLAGCGGDNDTAATGDKPTIRNASPWTEQQIIDALDLQHEPIDGPKRPARPGDLGMETVSGCSVSVLMTDKASVDLYAGAGDTVVTNPAGTAGVKTSGDEPACLAELERGLATLK